MAKKKTTKAKKKARVAKRRPVRAAAKAKRAKVKKPARKPVAKKAPARPAMKAQSAAAKADAERRRLIREQRALERDVENEPVESRLSESPEYIKDAVDDPLGEELAEAAVGSEVSGDQEAENIRDEDIAEENGGPFVETTANQEFAKGTDGSNPFDAEPAAFPTANAQPRR
jgi:hypothetical protein